MKFRNDEFNIFQKNILVKIRICLLRRIDMKKEIIYDMRLLLTFDRLLHLSERSGYDVFLLHNIFRA